MMTPIVTGKTEGMEFRTALFRVRLLLALHQQARCYYEKERKTDTNLKVPLSPQPSLSHDAAQSHDVSLLSIDLGEENNDAASQHDRGKIQYLHDKDGNVEKGVKEKEEAKEQFIITGALPLPPLHWPPPTLQQRRVAMEKRKLRQQKRVGHGRKLNWFSGESLTAFAGAHDVKNKVGDCYVRCGDSSSSSLTLTGDHSDKSESRDTYAESYASTDDVYIHELARKFGSPRTLSGTLHCRYNSTSISNQKTHNPFLMSSSKNDMVVASSESTAITAQREFDRIGTGEEAPYTSYLFSPDVRVVDLSHLHFSVSDIHEKNNANNVADAGGVGYVTQHVRKQEKSKRDAAKDGCTKVCFSPEGNCYVIGTLRGELWFVQVNMQSFNSSATTALNPILLQAHSGAITDVAFDDVGTFFASGGADACVILWNQRTQLKVRRINTDGAIPAIVRFMPKNNNYLLVSIPQHHLLRLYNSSTGLPVTRKGPVMRVQATAVAMELCADPFFFVGDVHGTITMWRFCVSSDDGDVLPSVVTEDHEDEGKRQPRQPSVAFVSSSQPPPITSQDVRVETGRSIVFMSVGQDRQRQRVVPVKAEGHPQFEKMASITLEKGTPVGTLVVSSMNHQQFHSLLRAQHIGQNIAEKNTVKKWAVAAFAGARQRHEHLVLSSKDKRAGFARSACAVMLLASFPCDRLEIICVQASKFAPRGYKLVPMLVMNGACRIRQISGGTAFCLDNTRCPTFSCTCEEGFVHIITCTTACLGSLKGEGVKTSGLTSEPTQWNIMATLYMPCGGIPISLAWSPDMRLLVAVTEEGTLYEWQRVYLHHNAHEHHHRHNYFNGSNNYRDDDDSSAGPRAEDEVDEWQMYFRRERQRQMRQYHAEKGTDDFSGSSLSASDDW